MRAHTGNRCINLPILITSSSLKQLVSANPHNFKLLINPYLTYGNPKDFLKTNIEGFDDDEVYHHITLSFISATHDIYIYICSFISIQPLEVGLAGTRAQSCDRYGSGTLHPGQVLGGSLPLLYSDTSANE